MAELGKKLGKLSLAILENFIEQKLGKEFVDELRAPTKKALAVDAALENSDARLKSELEDRVFSDSLFAQVSDQYLGLLADVVGKFYDHPTQPNFQIALTRIFSDSFPYLDVDRIHRAVQQYIKILTEELALADDTFRENVRALAYLRGENAQQEMVNILGRVETLLEQREITQGVPSVFRSLHQLPQPPADFTGRGEMIELLIADLQHGKGTKISGLTGMGGIGKTSLGLVVAHKIADDYPDAQIFLDLKGTTAPLIAVEIMRHVILSFEPAWDLRTLDAARMSALYQSVLHGKRILLFLDNALSAEQIAALRPPDTCVMLFTSRWSFSVPGLHSQHVDILTEEESKTFLLELCSRISEHADKLARLCGYLPLALRIAGSCLGVNSDWNVEAYLEQLNDRRRRLATLKQSREEAELKTESDLLATFELSYQLLPEESQQRWRILAAFPGSFNAQAAGAMWDLEQDIARRVLGSLLRYSLLDYIETSSRYRLHDLLADYALSQMDADEEHGARFKHAAHYKDVLSRANALYMEGNDQLITGLHLFDVELENLRAGQLWLATGGNERATKELCIAYTNMEILRWRQHPRERIRWLEAALAAARQIGDLHEEIKSLGNLGNAYQGLGDVAKGIQFYETQLAMSRELGDRHAESAALGDLGASYQDLRDIGKAITYHRQRFVVAREIGDRGQEAQAFAGLGTVYADLVFDRDKAIEFYERALIIYRELGDRASEARILNSLAHASDNPEDHQKSIELYEQSLAIASELGDRVCEGAVLTNLGQIYRELGDMRKAAEFFQRHLVVARGVGDRIGEAISLVSMGSAFKSLGEERQGNDLIRQGLEVFESVESPYAEWARDELRRWEPRPKREK